MPIGPGKYDHYLTPVMQNTNAFAGVLIVIGEGDCGASFCVQSAVDVSPILPDMLRRIANEIEKTIKNESSTIPPVKPDGGDSVSDQTSGAI